MERPGALDHGGPNPYGHWPSTTGGPVRGSCVSKCASWPADTVPTVPRTPGCYYVGERELGLAPVDELLCRTDLPPAYVSSLHENRRFHEH